jgi:hypothetical protein
MRLTHYDGRWMTPEERDLLRWQKTASPARADLPCPMIISDIAPFQTAGDNVAITSRSELRDYERKNGVRQVGNDIPPPPAKGNQ